jgi:hypothetical protein
MQLSTCMSLVYTRMSISELNMFHTGALREHLLVLLYNFKCVYRLFRVVPLYTKDISVQGLNVVVVSGQVAE